MHKKIKIFSTLGPSSMNRETVTKLDHIGIDLFRINLSHTKIEELDNIISRIRKYTTKPICIDTEGAQIRIGDVKGGRIFLKENDIIEIMEKKIMGDAQKISFTPQSAVSKLKEGDLVSIDFDSVLLKIVTHDKKHILAKVVSAGFVGSNKAVTLDRDIELPIFSEKDKKAIKIGLKNDVTHYALSFSGDAESVRRFRKLVGKTSHVISKIESKKGVENIDEIIKASDSILIDRGDLSREEPIEKIPFIQKLVIRKANAKRVPVYVATNLLESMVKSKTPTRAEINDIVNTLLDGADGVVLAAETAIGKYPVNCAAMVTKTIKQFSSFSKKTSLKSLEKHDSFLLVEPHGGNLVNRIAPSLDLRSIKRLKYLTVPGTTLLDAEQIAIGTFSPVEGFMGKKEIDSVLDNYRLANGAMWTLPIVLQVKIDKARRFRKGDTVALRLENDKTVYAVLYLEEIFKYDLEKMALKMFGTNNLNHPGVTELKRNGNYFLAGKINLIKRPPSRYRHFEITPKQARSIFEAKGWSTVVGFHTRNVIHRVHEHIQMLAMKDYHCDGIFIHPVVGPKKKGDYEEGPILRSYELMLEKYYPKNKVFVAAFRSYSRYAGPREAVFTALCRKNYGCSHFVVGRDHTGVGDFYNPYDVHELFDYLGDIGIIPIFFKEMIYCSICKRYVEKCAHAEKNAIRISGSKARQMLKAKQNPPEWFMRKEISKLILDDIKEGKKVFVA